MRRLLLVLILMTGCAQVGLENQSGAPPMPQAKPPQGWRLTQGEALYIRHCADCHGWQGRGIGPVGRIFGIKVPSLRRAELYTEHGEAALLDWVLYGKPLSVDLDAARLTATDEEIDALEAYLRRLPTIPWEQIDRGQQRYDSLCISCHGLYGRGDGLLAASLPTFPRDLSAPSYQRQVSDVDLARIIADGQGMMPGVGDIMTGDEIWEVVTYVRHLSPGYELYTRFCAICHGDDGRPAVTDPEGATENEFPPEEIPQVVFNQAYLMTRSEAEIRRGIRHMLQQSRAIMPHFSGELSRAEVRQIFDYLRTLP